MHGIVEQSTAVREHAFPSAGPRRGMRARVKLGQQWVRRGDGRVFTVHMPHYKDRVAELRAVDGERIFVTYTEMRRKWSRVA